MRSKASRIAGDLVGVLATIKKTIISAVDAAFIARAHGSGAPLEFV
jgi:hypothetical protein